MSDEQAEQTSAPAISHNTFLTMIVPASHVDLARSIAASADPGGVGMWQTPLSASGKLPAEYFISTGYVQAAWQMLTPVETWQQDADGNWIKISETPGDSVRIFHICQASGLAVTQEEVNDLFDAVDITQQDPWTALSRLGVQIAQPDDDATQEGEVSESHLLQHPQGDEGR